MACSAYKSVVESHASSDLQLYRIEFTLPRLTITSSVRSSHIRQIPTLLAKSQGHSKARRLEFFAIFAYDTSVAVPSNHVTDLEAMLCALDGTVDASTVADHQTIWHAHVIEKFERLPKANTTRACHHSIAEAKIRQLCFPQLSQVHWLDELIEVATCEFQAYFFRELEVFGDSEM